MGADDDPEAGQARALPPSDLLPRALRDPAAVARRRALLRSRPPRMAPLIDLTQELRRQQPRWQAPDVDPASGGAEARVLILLEKPGPQAAPDRGTGFVSLHNDSATSAAIHDFALVRNGLALSDLLLANAVPWWDGSIAVTAEQRRLAPLALASLLALLPRLSALVLAGGTAQAAWDRAALPLPPQVRVCRSAHPSPQVRAASRALWDAIPDQWPRAPLD